MNLTEIITRLLKERLTQFNVPTEIMDNITSEIVDITSSPNLGSKGNFYVMTAENSIKADNERHSKPS